MQLLVAFLDQIFAIVQTYDVLAFFAGLVLFDLVVVGEVVIEEANEKLSDTVSRASVLVE